MGAQLEQALKAGRPAYEKMFLLLEPVLAPLRKAVNFGQIEQDVFHVMVPESSQEFIDARPSKGWAFTSLEHAAVPFAVYAIIVVAGLIRFGTCGAARKDPADKRSAVTKLIQSPLRVVMLLYNIVQVALCTWMAVFAFGIHANNSLNMFGCNPALKGGEADDLQFVLWVFYVSKILDFLDTVFIVVKGEINQFSLLHIYHHFSIFAFYWLNVNVGYHTDIYVTIILNGAIHAFMYAYYGLSLVGIRLPGMLITVAQMTQFVAMMTQGCVIAFTPGCKYPSTIAKVYVVYILSLFILFAEFFVRKYLCGGKGKGKGKTESKGKKGKKGRDKKNQ